MCVSERRPQGRTQIRLSDFSKNKQVTWELHVAFLRITHAQIYGLRIDQPGEMTTNEWGNRQTKMSPQKISGVVSDKGWLEPERFAVK